MATEEYCVGYDEGYQAGWNAAIDSVPPSKPWVSLTDEEIEVNWQFLYGEEGSPPDHHDFARAIEAALRSKNT